VSCGAGKCTYRFSLVIDGKRRLPVQVRTDGANGRQAYTVDLGRGTGEVH